MPHLRFALIACTLLAACSSTREQEQNFELQFLPMLESLELEYEGSLSSRGLPSSTMTLAVGRQGEMVTVHCEIFATSAKTVATLFEQDGVWLRAVRIDNEVAESLREDLQTQDLGHRVQESQMRLGRGGSSHLVVADQHAFVSSFELRSLGTGSIGDPTVSYAQDGFLLELRSQDGEPGTPCELDIDMSFCTRAHPLSETTTALPGATQEVTIQTPVFTTQKVHVEAEFLEDTSVLVGPIPGPEGADPLLVLLRLELDSIDAVSGQE